ncbi:MAG: hypothetical protein HZB64_01940 [Rhodocyclales bacterium]|nr:hypothetical protein [Rhodocyclales bacterium]
MRTPSNRLQPALGLAAALATLAALHATPSIAAPVNYEMDLRTASGLGAGSGMAGGIGSALGMLFGGQGASVMRTLDLRLVNPADIPEGYSAAHTVPAAMHIGPALPLTGERRTPGESGRSEETPPDGRVLIYWGCSATVSKGQPEVIDFKTLGARVSPEVMALAQRGRMSGGKSGAKDGAARASLPPRTLGWPWGDKDFRGIPDNASAVGEHVVKASFMPQEIRFTLDKELDFLEPINLKTTAANTRATIPLTWDALTRARGYDLSAAGANGEKELVLWLATKGKSPMLPGRQHECTIPAGIFAKTQMTMVSAEAYGPVQGFAYPPQKPGEKKPLVWTARVRVNAFDGLLVGMQEAATDAATGAAVDSVAPAGAGSLLKGLFGR